MRIPPALFGQIDFGLQLTVIGRIALGSLLGYLIGYERELRGSTAGDRTFALVGLGAAGFTALGVEVFPGSADRVIAGIVTGIGFLGAGLIFRGEMGTVRGLTTAASMWAAASVAVLVGAGELFIGVAATALVLLILEMQHVRFLQPLAGETRRPPPQEPSGPEGQPRS